MSEQVLDTDVLVVGGGGAGFRAAIESAEKGAWTMLVSKGPLARCGASPLAGSDLTVDGNSLRDMGFLGDQRDTKQKFFNDIVTQGFYLGNQRLVEIYVRDAPKRIKELLDWGINVKFSEERAIFTSGISIMDALLKKAKESEVEIRDDLMITDLLKTNGRIAGAVGININNGQFMVFESKAVVLATGGWHKAYSPNAGTRELSGDGQAMAYRAGAELANMEFVTFCCDVLLWPRHWRGSIFTYILSLLVGGKLTNSVGEDFLKKYGERIAQVGTSTEWNKSFVSVATTHEVLEGKGSPHGGVYYGIGEMPWEIFESKVVKNYPNWRYKGVDFSELGRMLRNGEPIEVGAAAEYFEGGIVVNEGFETNIPGLYAAGECSSSLFGANRVAAATTEMLVEGAIAGRSAAEYAGRVTGSEVKVENVEKLREKEMRPLNLRDGMKPSELRKHIQKMAHEKLGPIRNKEGICELVDFLENVKRTKLPTLCTSSQSSVYNKEWIEALELENIVETLELSAKSASMRTESRGVHFRSDYPNTDNDNWLKEIIVRRDQEEHHELRVTEITVTKTKPTAGKLAYFEMMKRMMESHSEITGHH